MNKLVFVGICLSSALIGGCGPVEMLQKATFTVSLQLDDSPSEKVEKIETESIKMHVELKEEEEGSAAAAGVAEALKWRNTDERGVMHFKDGKEFAEYMRSLHPEDEE